MRHKLLAGFLAVTMLGAPLSVLAEENVNTGTINYASAGYLFEKISHPDKPQSTPDGIVDYVGNGVVSAKDNGQGDRGQNYSWSAIGYGDNIYIGTCYAAMGNTLTLMGNVLGDKFDKETMRAILITDDI